MRTTTLALSMLSALFLASCDDGGTTGSIDSADPNAVVIEPATPADPVAPADGDTTTTQ